VDINGKIQRMTSGSWNIIYNNQYPGFAKRIAVYYGKTYILTDYGYIYSCDSLSGTCS